MQSAIVTILACMSVAACTINPVTGQRELALVTAADEVSIGRAQYVPSRQMQGGDYVADPALTRYVGEVGQRLAAVSDRALPYEFVVLDNSVPNAWALPGGKIAVNRGLLVELDSEAELAAVLGHEIVHAAARHGAQAMQRGLLLQLGLIAAGAASRGNDYSNLVVGAAGVGAQLINQRYGRGDELEADAYGMQYMSRAGYDPRAAVSLQETFLRLAEGQPEQGWLAGLFASHPPSAERVAANRNTAATLPSGGALGREPYRAAIASLLDAQPAFDAYDEGRAALRDGDVARARNLAEQAVRLAPREGHFHALLGDIDLSQNRHADAIGHFRDAISRNDRFFYYALQKGRAERELGQLAAARSDFEASLALLPTAEAHFGLGAISEREGDAVAALSHYRQAAEATGSTGAAAQDAVVRLDLPNDPSRYLTVRGALDTTGRLGVEVANPTRLRVGDVRLAIRYVDAQGNVQVSQQGLREALPPGGVGRLATGLGPFTSDRSFEVTIASASVVTQ